MRWLLWVLLICCTSLGQDMKAVQNLHASNFDTLTAKGRWVVLFFRPSCPPCLQLLEPLANLSSQHDYLELFQLRLGMVDCHREANLCHQHDVRIYPSFLWRMTPNLSWTEMPNPRGHLSGLKLFLQKLMRPQLHIQQVSRKEQLLTFSSIDAGEVRLVLLLPTVSIPAQNVPASSSEGTNDLTPNEAYDIFIECFRRGAGYPLLYFAVCRSTDLLFEFTKQRQGPHIALFKDEGHLLYTGSLLVDDVSQWVHVNRFPLMINLNEMLASALRDRDRSLALLAYDSRKEKSAPGRASAFARSLYAVANDTTLQGHFIFGKVDVAEKWLRKWLRPTIHLLDKGKGRVSLPTLVVYDPHKSWVWHNDAVMDQISTLAWTEEPFDNLIRHFLYRIVEGDENPHLIGLLGVYAFLVHLVQRAPTWLLVLGIMACFFVSLVLPLAFILNCVLDVLETRASRRLAKRMVALGDRPAVAQDRVVWAKGKDKQA